MNKNNILLHQYVKGLYPYKMRNTMKVHVTNDISKNMKTLVCESLFPNYKVKKINVVNKKVIKTFGSPKYRHINKKIVKQKFLLVTLDNSFDMLVYLLSEEKKL